MQESFNIAELVKSVAPVMAVVVSLFCTIIIPVLLFRANQAARAEKTMWKRIDENRDKITGIERDHARLEGKFEMMYNEHERLACQPKEK